VKKVFPYILVIILSFTNLVLVNKLNTLKKSYSNINNQNQKALIYELEDDINKLLSNDSLKFLSEQQVIDKNIRLESINGEELLLQDIITDKSKLIFMFSELNCISCYEKIINDLNRHINVIGKENVLILAYYSNPRELYAFMRVNQIKCKVYNIESKSLGLMIDNENIPYLFLLDSSFKTNFMFIPDKKYTKLTEAYLNWIKKQLFNANAD